MFETLKASERDAWNTQNVPPCPWVFSDGLNDPRLVNFPAKKRVGFKARIGLLDVPVDMSHPAILKAKVVTKDFVNCSSSTHGTIGAAAIIGRLKQWEGLFPEVELFVAGVLGLQNKKHGSAKPIVRGIEWLISREVDAMVLPFGHSVSNSQVWHTINLIPSRVIVYAAAGNQGPDQILFPANMGRVIAVSGVNYRGKILPQCCANTKVSLVAPGFLYVPGKSTDGNTLYGSSAACVLAVATLPDLLEGDTKSETSIAN